MEQILIIEDDMGLNQGLCRALKSENRQVISCLNLKTGTGTAALWQCITGASGYQSAGWQWLDFLKELKAADPVRPSFC